MLTISPFVPDFNTRLSRPSIFHKLCNARFLLRQTNLLWPILPGLISSLSNLSWDIRQHTLNIFIAIIAFLNPQRLTDIPINQPRLQGFLARVIIFIMLDRGLRPCIVKSPLFFCG